MSKKIRKGDTLTVGDLTDDYLGAVIEVGPTPGGITYRLRLDSIERIEPDMVKMWTAELGAKSASRNKTVTVIAPPPVVQPDEPTILGQCIRIEGDDGWLGVLIDSEDVIAPFCDADGYWWSWDEILAERAKGRQIIVSDPPRWPDEDDSPKAGDVFTSIKDMPYGWIAKAVDASDADWGYVVREEVFPQFGIQHTHRWAGSGYGAHNVLPVSEWASFGHNSVSGRNCKTYTLVETVEDHDARVEQDT